MEKEVNVFEKYKICKRSTAKVVCNVYMDAFGIDKVRFQNCQYKEKTSVDCYLDFEDLALLATDATTGRLIKKLDELAADKKQMQVAIGGSKSSKTYSGKPESRIMSFGKSGDTIFVNISRGKGKIGDKGQIMPDGAPDLKIGVSMSVDEFRSMLIYTHDCVNAYLAKHINALVRECEEDRKKYRESLG